MRHRTRFPVDAPALARVGSAASAYTRFAYSYARSAKEAYAKEWRNYDAFGGSHGLDNDREPSRALERDRDARLVSAEGLEPST